MPAALAAAAVGYALRGPGDYAVTVLEWIAINALLAAGMRFVMLIGEINFGCVTFLGLGAYASGIATVWYKLPLPLALLAGAVVGAAAGALFGCISLRTKGAYFFLIGFALTEVTRLIYTRIDAIGGNSGLLGIYPPVALDRWYPAIMVLVTCLALVGLYAVERSTLGKVFAAVRGNNRIVQAAGISVLAVKVACLAIASFVTGLAGALQAHAANVISPGDFGAMLAAFALAYVKVGGESHIMGTLIGTAGLTVLDLYVRGFGALEDVLFGAAILAAMLILPEGVYGAARRLLARQRRSTGSAAGRVEP